MVIPTCQGDTASRGGAKVAEAVPCFCILMEKLLRRSLCPPSSSSSFLACPTACFIHEWVNPGQNTTIVPSGLWFWEESSTAQIQLLLDIFSLEDQKKKKNVNKLHKYHQVAAALPLNLCTCRQTGRFGGGVALTSRPSHRHDDADWFILVVKWRPWLLLFFFCPR